LKTATTEPSPSGTVLRLRRDLVQQYRLVEKEEGSPKGGTERLGEQRGLDRKRLRRPTKSTGSAWGSIGVRLLEKEGVGSDDGRGEASSIESAAYLKT